MASRIISIHKGQQFGRLTAMCATKSKKHCRWLCRCVCGAECVIDAYRLDTGETRSCGCLRKDVNHLVHTKHGGSAGSGSSPEYRAWQSIKKRCFNPRDKSYPYYGGRGITMDPVWRNDFLRFLDDVGVRPPRMTLDRINNDGNYQPGNCRWATRQQQALNTRRNRLFEFRGKKQSLKNWAAESGIKVSTLSSRIFRCGWAVDRALTSPIRKTRHGMDPS